MGKGLSLLDKIQRYIKRLNGVEFSNESSTSQSKYYNVNGVKIRVSDHIAPTFTNNLLEILVSANEESVVISYTGRISVIRGYEHIKEFIRNFIFTMTYLRPKMTMKTKEVVIEKVETKVEYVKEWKELEELTDKQRTSIQNAIHSYQRQNKKSVK